MMGSHRAGTEVFNNLYEYFKQRRKEPSLAHEPARWIATDNILPSISGVDLYDRLGTASAPVVVEMFGVPPIFRFRHVGHQIGPRP